MTTPPAHSRFVLLREEHPEPARKRPAIRRYSLTRLDTRRPVTDFGYLKRCYD